MSGPRDGVDDELWQRILAAGPAHATLDAEDRKSVWVQVALGTNLLARLAAVRSDLTVPDDLPIAALPLRHRRQVELLARRQAAASARDAAIVDGALERIAIEAYGLSVSDAFRLSLMKGHNCEEDRG